MNFIGSGHNAHAEVTSLRDGMSVSVSVVEYEGPWVTPNVERGVNKVRGKVTPNVERGVNKVRGKGIDGVGRTTGIADVDVANEGQITHWREEAAKLKFTVYHDHVTEK
ncbi:hypothetical protein H0H93_012483 [Arthromyces matolae]|nr:hypothetical protein H0H93_012483 [Arthromyces matolae]